MIPIWTEAQSIKSIVGYGKDYSDGSSVCFFSNYPNIAMADNLKWCKSSNRSTKRGRNAVWTGDYKITDNTLTLIIKNLKTWDSPDHKLGVGYTVTLEDATFRDGNPTNSFILYEFRGHPSTSYIKKEIPIILLGHPELSVTAEFSSEVLKATNKGEFIIKVINSSNVSAKNVVVSLHTDNHSIITDSQSIGTIRAGSSQTVTLYVTGKETLTTGAATIDIKAASDQNYFTSSSISILTQSLFVKPLYPPDLIVENIKFIEHSGNRALDAYESGEISFTLRNIGRGDAQNIQINISPLTSDEGISYTASKVLEKLDLESHQQISFTLIGKASLKTSPRKFRIQITEEFGFDADPFTFSFDTVAYDPPDFRIEKVAINDSKEGDAYGNGNSIIEAGESIEVTAFVQNYGTGAGESVKAKIVMTTNDKNITCPDLNKVTELGTISPGDYRQFKFYFYTSRRYKIDDIPVKIILDEAKGLYGKSIDLGLKLGKRTPNIADVQIAKITKPKTIIKDISELAKSDVDEPPKNLKTNRPDGLAVIIGIEKYKYAPDVTFAERDAAAFFNATTHLLGVPENNIYYITSEGATKGEFEKLFSKDGWLARRVSNNSDIFVYYSGHGAPDIRTKTSYLIPHDTDPNYANKGYSLKTLYDNLNSLNAKSITVILDTCFSGQSREAEILLANARPIYVELESPLSYGNIMVLSASEKSQISSGYPEKNHGLFTYFFLKGLQGDADQNNDNSIDVKELFNFTKVKVSVIAGTLDREQTPTILGKNKDRVLVIY